MGTAHQVISTWAVTVFLGAAGAAPPDDLAIVRERLIDQLIVAPDKQGSAATQCGKWATALKVDGTWPDIDYTDQTRGAWKTYTHIERVESMANCFHEGPSANSTTLLSAIHASFDLWLTKDFKNPNWWYNEIGVPTSTGHILLLLGPSAVSPSETAKGFAILERAKYGTTWTGANLVWMVKCQIVHGALANNASLVDSGFTRLWQEIYWAHMGDDNIQRDGSFHQHSGNNRGMMLSGSYGNEFSTDMINLVGIANATIFAVPTETLEIFVTLLLDGQQWATTPSGYWDWEVIGRGNSNPGHTGPDFDTTILSALPSSRSQELTAFAAQLNQNKTYHQKPGNRHFWDSDYMVHRREGFMATLRMYSTRTIAARCVNAQGKLNAHEADGVMSLYGVSGGNAEPYVDVFPVWNWTRLAGMSYPHGLELAPCTGYDTWPDDFPGLPFVAGVSDGMYGTAAANISVGGGLRKQAAWFFGDTAAVHAAHVVCDTPTRASTALAQHLLGDADVYVGSESGTPSKLANGNRTVDGSNWVFHARFSNGSRGTGYALLNSSQYDLSIELGPRFGDWSALGTAHGTISRNIFGLWVEHDCAKLGNEVTFAVFPNVHLDDMNSAVQQLRQSIQENRGAAQASQVDPETSKLHAAFWTPGAKLMNAPVGWQMQASDPCVVIVEEGGPTVVSISMATPLAESLTITIDRPLHGENCTVLPDNSTVFHFTPPKGDYLGQSQTVVCGV